MITVQTVSKYLASKELFQEVSFHVSPSDKIGLIGPNGAGKTTLFQILLGEIEPDSGTVSKSKNLRIGYLPQQWTPLEGKTILAHAIDADDQLKSVRSELARVQGDLEAKPFSRETGDLALRQSQLFEHLEHLGGYDIEARAARILSGLGFRGEMLHQSVSSLSGGWTMRLELARLLLAEPDLLLLDEPTNHLDLESLEWLENYLVGTSSSVVLVSHDRVFINRVVDRILELEQGRLQEFPGNYDDYLEEKAKRQEIHLASYKNQQDRLRQIERFIERNRYRKDKARQVQSRIKLLDKVEKIEAPLEQSEVEFTFPTPHRCGRRVLELQGVSKSYGNKTVYDGIDFTIERGDKIALLGPNGAGKSTLLKMLAGVESPSSGERVLGHQVVPGYYAQYQWEQLHAQWTILEEASSVSGDIPQSRLRSLLGTFLFRGDDVLKMVAVLSGGEKARLILCKLLLQRPNFLLLDEPTNHLDIASRDVLERALEEFPGTVCFISHDRHFINSIANKVLFIDAGRIHLFPGNYSDFQGIWTKRLESSGDVPASPQKGSQPVPPRKIQDQKRLEAQWRNELYRLKKPIQEELQRVEAELEANNSRLDFIKERLADPNTYKDGSSIKVLQIDYQQCQRVVNELTSKWEESALALEDLEERFWKERKAQA